MLKTPQSFFAEWNDRPLDFDHAYGNQCVDVFQQYNKELFNGDFISGDTAIEIFTRDTFPQDIYEKVLNTPLNVPQVGDIIFFTSNHVAIVVCADVMSVTVFEQNFPQQGYVDEHNNFIGTGVCHFGVHGYTDVAGWLTPKK